MQREREREREAERVYSPDGHLVHVIEPVLPLYCPILHILHVAPSPGTSLYLPKPQGRQPVPT